jgi:hypothetical protein
MRADTPDLVSQFDDPQNYIAVALAEPDELLALLVGLVLEAHAAERERPGDSLERGLADRDADHAVKPASLPSVILSCSNRLLAQDHRFCASNSATSMTEESDARSLTTLR